jgi:hypothetical protein
VRALIWPGQSTATEAAERALSEVSSAARASLWQNWAWGIYAAVPGGEAKELAMVLAGFADLRYLQKRYEEAIKFQIRAPSQPGPPADVQSHGQLRQYAPQAEADAAQRRITVVVSPIFMRQDFGIKHVKQDAILVGNPVTTAATTGVAVSRR